MELAGGDYLPWPSVDYRGYIYAVRTLDNEIITTTLNQNDTELSFEISQSYDTLLAPLTWFKGYQAYWQNEDGTWIKLDTSMNEETGLVQFITANKTGNFKICYEKTTVQRIGILTTCTTLLLSLFLKLMKLLKLKSSA